MITVALMRSGCGERAWLHGSLVEVAHNTISTGTEFSVSGTPLFFATPNLQLPKGGLREADPGHAGPHPRLLRRGARGRDLGRGTSEARPKPLLRWLERPEAEPCRRARRPFQSKL